MQISTNNDFPSVLQHCWLGDTKGIQPVKWSKVNINN